MAKGKMNELSIMRMKDTEYSQQIKVVLLSNKTKELLLEEVVDINEFTTWFFKNELEIKTVDYPISLDKNKSIAENISLFYNSVDVDNDDVIDKMYDYRCSHCLRFAARGIDFPEVYIGKKDDGYELSLCSFKEKWRYKIDIDDFFSNIRLFIER